MPDYVPMSSEDRQPPRDRVTVVFTLNHEHPGDQTYVVPLIMQKFLENEELESYSRKIKVSEQPIPLPLGDMQREDIGLVIIHNIEGQNPQSNPTVEELIDLEQRVVTLNGGWEVPPGCFHFGHAQVSGDITLRCLYKSALCRVYLIPR